MVNVPGRNGVTQTKGLICFLRPGRRDNSGLQPKEDCLRKLTFNVQLPWQMKRTVGPERVKPPARPGEIYLHRSYAIRYRRQLTR
jgi:hypothetical protein